jgi:hypothetical protein
VKSVTDKPVVTVGRFTSPDTMAGQVRRGITDLIGAARPSIADPFLPKKIEEGRLSAIRECIGCNICYAGDSIGVPIRCTQNPTMGEEWRRAGTPNASHRRSAAPACWSWAPDLRGSRPRARRGPRLRRDAGRGHPRARRPRHARAALPG